MSCVHVSFCESYPGVAFIAELELELELSLEF